MIDGYIIIIGSCITTVFPGGVCPLGIEVAECNPGNLSATNCICEEGFKFAKAHCLGHNEETKKEIMIITSSIYSCRYK